MFFLEGARHVTRLTRPQDGPRDSFCLVQRLLFPPATDNERAAVLFGLGGMDGRLDWST